MKYSIGTESMVFKREASIPTRAALVFSSAVTWTMPRDFF